MLPASEALAIGLISRVMPSANFDADVASIVEQLACAGSTTLALIKKQLYELDGRSFLEAVKLGSEVNAIARSTPSFQEAVARFLSKE